MTDRQQWNDIDWSVGCRSLLINRMRAYREFQFDDNYSPAEYGAFVDELHSNNQYYVSLMPSLKADAQIPIIDAAVGYLYNDTDVVSLRLFATHSPSSSIPTPEATSSTSG